MAIEQAHDPRLHRGQHLCHVQRGETKRWVKREATRAVSREDAVRHEGVDMHVEIQRAAEPLDDGNGAATTFPDALIARASAQHAEHGADEHTNDRATHVVIPR
jgi:hypothetical protein